MVEMGVIGSPIVAFSSTDPASAKRQLCEKSGPSHASGDGVCYFDVDDEMFPTYLERFATAFHANPQARMVRWGVPKNYSVYKSLGA